MVSNKSLDDRFMFSPDVNTTLINTDSELEKILTTSDIARDAKLSGLELRETILAQTLCAVL